VLPSAPDADDPQHWRDREAQMRALAVKMAGSEAAILVNDLATDYEKLAERAKSGPMGKSRDRLASRASGVDFAGADRPYRRGGSGNLRSSDLCCRSQYGRRSENIVAACRPDGSKL
jgi:hypothetical protein